ncbi:MAG: biotin/lipoyl-binding protein [Verrucomicrobiota bacterium]|nr:biotin/lipoyl-binding protein [Limisphaera sp.]MDW8381417.1 biotin/lipoyl-binding protein [Verrucomicrobiota bacterium]
MTTDSLSSESWHRLADQRLALRPDVRVRRQFFRGELWYVLEDPLTNQFFRLAAPAYEFVARMDRGRTVQQAWEAAVRARPDTAPGQEEVVRLLAQLHQANLLLTEQPPDSVRLFQRARQRRQRQWQTRLLGIMFARIPLWDPDPFLQRLLPWIRWVFGPVGMVLWLGTVSGAIKVALDHAPELTRQTEGILAPQNWFLLYAGFALLKLVHEFGHALLCRHFGGRVHTMGLMLLIFTPVPYVDVTSAWSFRSRTQRLWVGAGGMWAELFVAACMTFVWAATAPGTLHSLAFNMMFLASVSTVLFNANPLMRFDGYYLLSDALDIPNLYGRANQMLAYWIERHAFGRKEAENPARSRREAVWLGLYAVCGHVYRVVIFAGILLFVGKRYLLLGALMAVVCLVGWVIVPMARAVMYLLASPRLERCRGRALGVAAGVLAGGFVLLGAIPFPHYFRAAGVVQAKDLTLIPAGIDGRIVELLTPPGRQVQPGQPLVRLDNPELELELQSARAEWEETVARERRALHEATADVRPLAARRQAVEQRIRELEEELAARVVVAPHAGQWVAPELDQAMGRWIPRGTVLGAVANLEAYRFEAVVSQREAAWLFQQQLKSPQVRLRGQAGEVLSVLRQTIIPAEHRRLPSAALGWQGGGPLAVAMDDPEGRRAMEPFFVVRADLASHPRIALLHGRSGQIRYRLASEPLLSQWLRRLHQLLQREYGW